MFQITLEQAVPTLSHVSIVKLQEVGLVKYVVSTNVDGLHRRAGTQGDQLAELHGNCYREVCNKCHSEYLRDFDCTKTGNHLVGHATGRLCDKPNCKGALEDTIIHFGESLPRDALNKSYDHANNSQLSVVLGTSMRVHPACDLPLIPVRSKTGHLAICNLQATPYDHEATLRIWAPTDVVMEMLMKELAIIVPETTPEGHPVTKPAPYSPDPDMKPQHDKGR